jgi:putative membrane protein
VTGDPRVFFAAERTLLAWVRTGIAIVGLGFVVERFGLFLQLMVASGGSAVHVRVTGISAAIGIALVLLGSIAMLLAARQHRAFIRTLPLADMPANYRPGPALVLAVLLGALSAALALHLTLTA